MRSLRRSSVTFSKVFGDIPHGYADESFPEEVRVLDPRHPLFGRRFQVLGRSLFRRVGCVPCYAVMYRDGVTLNVPVAATEAEVVPIAPTKLSVGALRDLLNVVDSAHEYGTRGSLDDAAGSAEAPDHRRRRRGSGGGVS